ncbi:MAG: endonuclease [Solirubrobacterales bacterium]|nr:endonuclease [Solirubrobacterales bacterium]
MAEGDTILRLARRIESHLAGERVAVSAPSPRGRAAGVERLDGLCLESAEARGKHLLLHFGPLVLHSHLGMSGGWHLYPPNAAWRRPRSAAWAVLSGAEQEAVQFGGPTLRLLTAERVRRDPQLSSLGPDVLGPDFDLDAVVAAMRTSPVRSVGDALLDQRLLAGVGNIFKSEACFAARVDPWRSLGDLSDGELRAVLLAAQEQMQDAVESGRKSFSVYRRRGPCPVCGGPLASRGQGDANRTTYWCPRCQGS